MTDESELHNRIRTFAAGQTPALAVGRAVIAVSGGADSIATAALLAEAGVIQPERCVVAHFVHRLRDDESAERDRTAVEALCARYGFDLRLGAWGHPQRGEAAAREARYAFLSATARRNAIDVIVTGHTSDDQVETVLMHALRGSGLRGMAGMLPERALDAGLRLARPVLCISRAETRAYCDEHDLAYHNDATNLDRAFLRNRVRLDVLPRMEAVTPDVRASLLRLAAEARDGVAALDAVAAVQLAAAMVEMDAASVTLLRAALGEVSVAVAPYVWRLVIERLLGDAREFERRHYDIMGAAASASTGAVFELPRGVRVRVDASTLTVSVGVMVEAAISAGFEAGLPFDGVAGAWRIGVGPIGDAVGGVSAVVLPSGAVVRGRRPGDRIQPLGLRGHKKLQDYYVDRKIARRHRDAAPVVACGGDVLWTPFGAVEPAGMGARYRISAERMTTPYGAA